MEVGRHSKKRGRAGRVVIRAVEHHAIAHAQVIVVRADDDVARRRAVSVNVSDDVRAHATGGRRDLNRTRERRAKRRDARGSEPPLDECTRVLAAGRAGFPALHIVRGECPEILQ